MGGGGGGGGGGHHMNYCYSNFEPCGLSSRKFTQVETRCMYMQVFGFRGVLGTRNCINLNHNPYTPPSAWLGTVGEVTRLEADPE